MGVVAFMSAKGAPGTTTTALLMAALWPAPVLLVDADPEGGDISLRLRREDGDPVDRSRGLLSLLPLARREMQPAVLPEHAQVLRGGIEAIAGLSGPEQAGAAGHLWNNLAEAFARTADRDVLLDCGRVSAKSVHLPLLQQAEVVVCLVRPTVSSIVHTRERLAALSPFLVAGDGHRPRMGVVIVADKPGGRDATGAAEVLERDLPGVEVFGRLALDADGASIFEGFEIPRPERTLLVRSGRQLVTDLHAALRHEQRGSGPASGLAVPAAVTGSEPSPVSGQADPPPGPVATSTGGRRAAPRRRPFSRAGREPAALDVEQEAEAR